ncbi:MAG: 23S rRNA (adenine(2503)-C(2))-methyltransferase RlmN [Gammaproteobacteria bacterium]|nr:23S rRNA (adenine(2503)-C(2))-methyltransferase RlmN [Gammaproteobacteria bacterium]
MSGVTNLLGLDRDALEGFFAGIGERPFRATQVMKWLHQQGVAEFQAMSNLAKTLRARLTEIATVVPPVVTADRASRDGTRKWLLGLARGDAVETVFIPEPGRGTLCVSSQVGCALDCSFCATGKQGFGRNLEAAEIIGQVWLAARCLGQVPRGEPLITSRVITHRAITNVVLMGMGEPLLNLDNVVPAMRLMLDDNAYGLSRRRVTLSTAGVVPQIERLRERCPVSLAVSLHAPVDALRDELVPINKRYPIAELLAACRCYAEATDTRITFEYVMLEGVNDDLACARELVKRLRGVPAKVNLIPFNPIPQSPYRRSPPEVIERFREVLLSGGIMSITRRTRGEDIDAACGQLVGKVMARAARHRPAVAAGATL